MRLLTYFVVFLPQPTIAAVIGRYVFGEVLGPLDIAGMVLLGALLVARVKGLFEEVFVKVLDM